MTIDFSELESKRFSKKIFRGTAETLDANGLKDLVAKTKADVTIVRYPVSEQANLYKLNQAGLNYIVADSLVYYQADLNKYTPKKLSNDTISFIKINETNKKELVDLIDVIFEDYTNHYFSNPMFKKKDILDGYKEWAENFLYKEDKDVFLVKKGEKNCAFANCSRENDQKVCEGVLYGVHPDFAGQGLYGDLIKYTMNYYKEQNFIKMDVSTQLQNFAVQKVWMREGFFINKAYLTLHIFSNDNI